MEANIYQAPESDLVTSDLEESQFYVVSNKKFLILFISTLGMYSIYWYYKNWKSYMENSNENIMPFWRAVFSIFFTHSLFRKLNEKALKNDQNHQFSNAALATFYVILTLGSQVTDQLASKGIGLPVTQFLSLLTLPFLVIIFYKAQVTANIASADPQGESNNSLTGANYLWIVIGLLMWVLTLSVYFMPEQFQ